VRSARRFLRDLGVRFRSVDLDTVEMQRSSLGADIRIDLRTRIGQPTIPQVFIAGQHVGGTMNLIGLQDRGEFLPKLKEAGVAVSVGPGVVARCYLRGWLASRAG